MVPDLKLLVVTATNASESPVKSKKVDLQEQLYREPRYSRVQAMANDFRHTLITTTSIQETGADAAVALLSLLTPVVDSPLVPPVDPTAV